MVLIEAKCQPTEELRVDFCSMKSHPMWEIAWTRSDLVKRLGLKSPFWVYHSFHTKFQLLPWSIFKDCTRINFLPFSTFQGRKEEKSSSPSSQSLIHYPTNMSTQALFPSISTHVFCLCFPRVFPPHLKCKEVFPTIEIESLELTSYLLSKYYVPFVD